VSEQTCDYAWMSEAGPMFCLAPATFSVRWHWLNPQPDRPEWDGGRMCEGHVMTACQELGEDADVEYESIQLMREGP
jgi:hypothetical protein